MFKNILFSISLLVCLGCSTHNRLGHSDMYSNLNKSYSGYIIKANADSTFYLLKSNKNPGSGECVHVLVYDNINSAIVFENRNEYHDAWWISNFEIALKNNKGIEIRNRNSDLSDSNKNGIIYIYSIKDKSLTKKNNL